VCDTSFRPVTDERDQQQVESVLQASLEEIDFDFAPLLEKARKRTAFHLPLGMEFPTKLVISNEIHANYTVIDLQTADRLGLLYDVLFCLSRARVSIALSRVATEKGAAFDSFYVTDLEGGKITDEATLRQLQTSLIAAATGCAYETK
jgi:[protein-PII] uridylyltransferase